MNGRCQHCREKLASIEVETFPATSKWHLCADCYRKLDGLGLDMRPPRPVWLQRLPAKDYTGTVA